MIFDFAKSKFPKELFVLSFKDIIGVFFFCCLPEQMIRKVD